jgi:hypothetical protein
MNNIPICSSSILITSRLFGDDKQITYPYPIYNSTKETPNTTK